MDIEREIRIAALENAVKFNGKANQGAVVGRLFSIDPGIKSRMGEVSGTIQKILKEVNSMDLDSQKKLLLELNPDYIEQQAVKKKEAKESRQEMPDLPGAVEGKVVTRMPPGPSKYAHAGHAVSFLINYLYAQKYKGKCILRFDDTNPDVERQEFVDAIKKDLYEYLDLKPVKEVFASDDMERFISYAEKLIDSGDAYCCSCPKEKISEDRRSMKECQHRKRTVEENRKAWQEMKEGSAPDTGLRMKIDMEHKNAVMRDPMIYRVVQTPHYRQKDNYKVWPLYDFESAVEDGLNGVTHVLRSNEFDSRIELQNHMLDKLGLPKPRFIHYGRSSIAGAITKGREIRKLIESGEYLGWDDPRLVTLCALQRRGIVKEALYHLAKQAGLSKAPTQIDFSMISAENRKILDDTAKRFFFIKDAVKVSIKGAPARKLELDMHPDLELGKRRFDTTDSYLLEKEDIDEFKDGEILRLIDNLNFIKKGSQFSYDSDDYLNFKGKGKHIVHFLPDSSENVNAEVLMPDTTVVKGLGEPALKSLKAGEVIQFQRFGFCRLDSIEDGCYKFWFAHK